MEFLDNGTNYKNEIFLKIAIVGKRYTGKTIFTSRLISKNYPEFSKLSLEYARSRRGFKDHSIKVKIKNKIFSLKIRDYYGDLFSLYVFKSFYQQFDIFLIFYDSFDRDSFEKVDNYLYQIKSSKEGNPFLCMLIENKYELNINDKKNDKYHNNVNDIVTQEESLEYADKNNIYFVHLSNIEKYEKGIK